MVTRRTRCTDQGCGVSWGFVQTNNIAVRVFGLLRNQGGPSSFWNSSNQGCGSTCWGIQFSKPRLCFQSGSFETEEVVRIVGSFPNQGYMFPVGFFPNQGRRSSWVISKTRMLLQLLGYFQTKDVVPVVGLFPNQEYGSGWILSKPSKGMARARCLHPRDMSCNVNARRYRGRKSNPNTRIVCLGESRGVCIVSPVLQRPPVRCTRQTASTMLRADEKCASVLQHSVVSLYEESVLLILYRLPHYCRGLGKYRKAPYLAFPRVYDR